MFISISGYLSFIFTAFCTVMIVCRLYNDFLVCRVSKNTEFCCCLTFFLFTSISHLATLSMEPFLLDALLLTALTHLYSGNIRNKALLIISIFFYRILVHRFLIHLSDMLSLRFFALSDFNHSIGLIAELNLIYIGYLCIHFIKMLDIKKTPNATPIATIIPGIFSFFLLILMSLSNTAGEYNIIWGISIPVLIGVNLHILLHCQEHMKIAAAEAQNQIYKNQLKIIEESNKQFLILKHDMHNHILSMSALLESQNYKELHSYLSKMQEFANNSTTKISCTGNTAIDSIVNYKLATAAENGITLIYTAEIPSDLHIDEFAITSILGNLIDNSLEALSQTPPSAEKKLELLLRYERDCLFINISNTFCGKVQKENGKFTSQKKDALNHGIGLQSVLSMVKKLQGSSNIIHDDNEFQVYIILPEYPDTIRR